MTLPTGWGKKYSVDNYQSTSLQPWSHLWELPCNAIWFPVVIVLLVGASKYEPVLNSTQGTRYTIVNTMKFWVQKINYQPPFVLLMTFGYYSKSVGVYSWYNGLTKGGGYSGGGDFGMEVFFNYLWVIVGTLEVLCCWMKYPGLIIKSKKKTLRNPHQEKESQLFVGLTM